MAEVGLERMGPILSQQLLIAVVEQLKVPLIQIAGNAELAKLDGAAERIAQIQISADTALQLLDNYVLGVRLTGNDAAKVNVEPVSVAAVLHDAGNQLMPIAKAYGVTLDLQLDGKYGPVMAHRRALQAAFVSLGYALVEALPAQETPSLQLKLSAHRCRYGIVAGLYCEMEQLTAQALQMGRRLQGHARQPFSTWSHTSAAGVFVADAILHAMSTRLMISRHRHLRGLGAVLPLNPQLQFI